MKQGNNFLKRCFGSAKRRFVFGLCLFACCVSGFAQDKGYDFEVYGWINPQYFLNSRHTSGARDGLLSLVPLSPRYSASGEDLNNKFNHNFSAATTRIGARIGLSDVLGARVVGNIEGDFTGQSDANLHLLRLRQANVKMQWDEGFALTAGHGWSVFCVPEMMPQMQELNNGTPFHPFSRLNQIRLDYSPVGVINLVGSLGWQKDYASIGINGGRDYKQQSRAMIPEVNLQLQFRHNGVFAGVTAEMKTLKPREDYDQTLTTYAANAFLRYQTPKLCLKLQAVYGENLNDYCLFGGYYERPTDLTVSSYEYAPTTVSSVWFEAIYDCGKVTPAVFIGYGEHLGQKTDWGNGYGTSMDLENVFRIAPRVDIQLTKDFNLCATVEYTNVKYRDEVCKERLENWRLGLMLLYKFSTK